jgi:hypothetical protein
VGLEPEELELLVGLVGKIRIAEGDIVDVDVSGDR